MRQKEEWGSHKFMDLKVKKTLCFAVSLAVSITVNAAGRMMAKVECKDTEQKLVYNCMIFVTEIKSGKKMDHAEFKVGADMPSMPGAHNVEPVEAKPMGMGMYNVRMTLEMYGEWALKLDFKKPMRDRIVKKMTFGKEGMEMKHDHGEEHKHKEGMGKP